MIVVIDSKEVSEKQNFYAPHYKNLYHCLYVSFTNKFNHKFSVSKVNRQHFTKRMLIKINTCLIYDKKD